MSTEDNLRKLNSEFCVLLQRRQPEALSIFSVVEWRLRQFGLSNNHDVCDVFNEVYIRAYNYVESGRVIRNYHAWIRRTSLNVIYEWSRGRLRVQKRHRPLDNALIEGVAALVAEPESAMSEEEQESYVHAVQQALMALGEQDREILQLRIVEDKSWSEIAACLVTIGEHGHTVEALRQRGHRALVRFRRIFHTL